MQKCSLNEIEDEKHALMICPAYDDSRKCIFDKIGQQNNNFINMSIENKFVWLLSNEDTFLIHQLSKLINEIM